MERVGHVSRMEKGTHMLLMWKSGKRIVLGIPRPGCKDNIKMDVSRNILWAWTVLI
jgi:hypothetical protein